MTTNTDTLENLYKLLFSQTEGDTAVALSIAGSLGVAVKVVRISFFGYGDGDGYGYGNYDGNG